MPAKRLRPVETYPDFEMLTLHHQPDKIETYRALHPFRFDRELDCLCVFDKELIAAIFRSDKFHVVAYSAHYRDIQSRTGLDFGAIIDALDHIPLANEGERHKALRSEMASIVGAQRRSTVDAMEQFVSRLIDAVVTSGGEVDLVGDIAKPLNNFLFSRWLGIDMQAVSEIADFSQIFDRTMSLNRRKKLNRNLGELSCIFAGKREELTTSPQVAVAMNIIGNDAFIGSIALSLWEVLSGNPGLRLDEIVFPQDLPSTGVPYIERIAVEDTEIGGMSVREGQRIRLFLDATASHVSGEDGDVLFGKGRHLCLGKPMTLAIWRSLTAALAAKPLSFTIGDMRLREGDYVFSYPDYATVRFHDR